MVFHVIWMVAAAGVSPAFAENRSGELFVSAVQGGAEYSTDHRTWHPLEPGLLLSAGAELRTTASSTADLVLKHCGTALRLLPASRLTLTRLSESFTGEEIITQTRLDLGSGGLIGSQRKLSKTSTFDIYTPTAVTTIRGTEYVVRADGAVSCLSGAVSVKFITPGSGQPIKVTVEAGFSFDPATGQVVVTTPAYLQNLIAHITTVRHNAQVFRVGKSQVIVKPVHKMSPTDGDDDDQGEDHGGNQGGNDQGGHGHGQNNREVLAHAFLVPNP